MATFKDVERLVQMGRLAEALDLMSALATEDVKDKVSILKLRRHNIDSDELVHGRRDDVAIGRLAADVLRLARSLPESPGSSSPTPGFGALRLDHGPLASLWISLFASSAQLARYLRPLPGFATLIDEVASDRDPLAQAADAVAQAAVARGIADSALFQRLRADIPGRADDIDAVEEALVTAWANRRVRATTDGDRETTGE